MRRRDFIAGALALAADKGAFQSSAGAQSNTPHIERIFEAHCHIFNANDLPVEGFVKKIILPDTAKSNQMVARFSEYPGALRALVHALAIEVKRDAPGIKTEVDKINEFEADPRKKPTRAWREGENLRNLKTFFNRIWFDGTIFRGLTLPEGFAAETAIEYLKLFLVQQISPEFGKPVLTPESREQLRNWSLDDLANKLYVRDDIVGRYIRWAFLFTCYRFELAEELALLHQAGGSQNSRLVMMTPATVDFSKWLEDENNTSIEDQVEVMTRIARRKDGPRVHGFVGFDPLRQALYDHGRRTVGEKEPLAVLQHAIETAQIPPDNSAKGTGGSIGVKLYPPMGFRATANAELPDNKFAEPGYLRSEQKGLGVDIGKKLDGALSRLYTWCNEKNVPIMAHTHNTYGPNPEYENRADPTFWARVIEPTAFPRLRINMAHFGHFDKAVVKSRPGDYIEQCWEWTVGKIFDSSSNSYAYADISSLSEILKTGPSNKILECMRAFRSKFQSSADRLIYGTDWSMIAQAEGFPRLLSSKPFPDLMVSFLVAVGYSNGQIEGIMFRNATRFVGMSKNEHDKFGEDCTRGRLEKFYAANRVSSDWMKVFD
jgi:predicted TIM-barrel fold metal-dependent hydrolase